MKEKGLSILDALENLNTLVDADSLDEIEVTEDDLFIPHKTSVEEEPELAYLKAGADEQTLAAIKETFRSVHAYLQTFYTKMKKGGDPKRLVEGINTIMVLVGEAAKKFDTFGALFKQRVTEFEEYKALQQFYRNQVIQETFRSFAAVPIPHARKEVLPEQQAAEEEIQALLAEEPIEEVAGVHILNDLDVIKRDRLYELFYLKNEADHHFYTYELARNIKLACDFGEFAKEYFGDDPLLQIKNWEDKSLHLMAGVLLKRCRRQVEKFYEEALQHKQMEVVSGLHNALMALMMAANPRNLIRQFAFKACHLYFQDFLLFLRATLHNREYQKFLLYAPPVGQPFFQVMLDLVQTLCYNLYTLPTENEEIQKALKQMVATRKHHKIQGLTDELLQANSALTEILKHHPNGPVFKVVDLIRDEQEHPFDPLHQGNLPACEWALISEDKQIMCVRIPCPTIQEVIQRAFINEEFRTFLHALHANERLLFINYQDRTSWKEHARSNAVEELSRQAEFAQGLSVVTLAKDTDFYNQVGIYHPLNDAQQFIEQFHDHLQDEVTGYYFPPSVKKALFPQWTAAMLKQIHHAFFEDKKELLFLERLDFIELVYHFITWKLIELIQPSCIGFSSKDGLDICGTASVGFIALLAAVHKKQWTEPDYDHLNTILFGPTLMHRERVVHPERLERLVSMSALLEKKREKLKEFASLLDRPTWNWEVKL
jgi:hypothetical protein